MREAIHTWKSYYVFKFVVDGLMLQCLYNYLKEWDHYWLAIPLGPV